MSPKPEDDDNSRTPAENRFLAECFLAFDDKVGKVDLTKVAQSMGHSNEASTGNRFGAMRKKYGFDKKCFHSSNQKGKESSTDSDVTPTKATPRPKSRKNAAPTTPNTTPKTPKTAKKETKVKSEDA